MKKFFEQVRTKLKAWREEQDNRNLSEFDAKLDEESRKVVQVMEFNGDVFFCINGIPLLNSNELKNSLSQTVQKARETYKDWKDEKRWEDKERVTTI